MNRPVNIPDTPGSYQFLDVQKRIIYVGKAKSLKTRINSYFNSSSLDPKTVQMLAIADSVEWIQVETESDALLLEDSLIKRYSPRFNVRLRDDKSYPSVGVNLKSEWPRIFITRNLNLKNTRYFGPYVNAGAIRETLELLQKIFPTRSCSDTELENHIKSKKPCLLYHIKRCSGPCIREVTKEDYDSYVKSIIKVLGGEVQDIRTDLEQKMATFAEALNYEQAAKVRDRISDLNSIQQKQTISSSLKVSGDIFGLVSGKLQASIKVLTLKNGLLIGHKGFFVDRVEMLSDEELMAKAIVSYYSQLGNWGGDESEKVILVSHIPSESELILNWLTEELKGKIKIQYPKSGIKNELVQIAVKNAKESLERESLKRAYDFNSRSVILSSLKDVLHLDNTPYRIECYDCSHLSGTNYVGSMVVFEDGLPKKGDYRIFKVNIGKNDDYLAMEEVLTRRFKRLNSDSNLDKSFAVVPDLVVIDGGKGQLSVANRVIKELNIECGLISLAKQFEEIYFPGQQEPLRIPRNSESLYLLERLRDEAHRFAIGHHRKLRNNSAIKSQLRDIPNIGPRRESLLLDKFKSVSNLKAASLEDLISLDFLNEDLAKNIFSYFHD
jgi:excinuclease ABC subunit C